jgi:hypothetical protein
MSGYQPNHLVSVFFKSMMFLRNHYQPMHFWWDASTIGWLAEAVDIILVSATAGNILLFRPISAITQPINLRCTHDLKVLAIGRSKPILVAFPYRSNMANQSLVSLSISTHFYQSIYRLKDRLYIYRSHTLNHTPIGYTSLNYCTDVIEPIQPHLVTQDNT